MSPAGPSLARRFTSRPILFFFFHFLIIFNISWSKTAHSWVHRANQLEIEWEGQQTQLPTEGIEFCVLDETGQALMQSSLTSYSYQHIGITGC